MHHLVHLPLRLRKIVWSYNPDVRRYLLLLKSRCVQAIPGFASSVHHSQAEDLHSYGEDRGSECGASHFSQAVLEMQQTDSLEKVVFPFHQHKYSQGIDGYSIYRILSDAHPAVP